MSSTTAKRKHARRLSNLPHVAQNPAADTPPRWLLPVGFGLLLVLVIMAPLYCYPAPTELPFEFDTPRRFAYQLGAGLLAALALVLWAIRRRATPRRHPLDLPVLLFTAGALLAGMTAANPHIALLAPLWSQDVDTLSMWLVGITLFFAVKELLREPESVRAAALAMLTVGTVVAIIGLLRLRYNLPFLPIYREPRLVGTLGNPVFSGTYLAMLVPLGVGLALAESKLIARLFIAAGTLLCLLGLLLTMTRGAWVGAFAGLLALVVYALCRPRRDGSRTGAVIALCGLLALVAVGLLHPAVRTRAQSMLNGHDFTLHTRLVAMQTAWTMFTARPITGWGPGNFIDHYQTYRPEATALDKALKIDPAQFNSLPHNLPLQITAEMGLAGILPFLLLVGVFIATGWRSLPDAGDRYGLILGLLGMVAAYLVAALTAIDNASSIMQFWLGLGLLAALTAAAPRMRAPLPGWTGGVLAVLGAAVALATIANVATQAVAWHSFGRAARAMYRVYDLTNHRQYDAAYALSQTMIADYDRALALTTFPDDTLYQGLFLGYKAQSQLPIAPDDETSKRIYTNLFQAGTRALALAPNNPGLLSMLASEYLLWEQPREARPLIDRLLAAQPRDAQAAMLHVDLLEKEGDTTQALAEARRAAKLDLTLPVPPARIAHYLLAQYQTVMAQRGDPRRDPRVREIVTHFQRALKLGLQPDAAAAEECATALFLAGDIVGAIRIAQPLRGSPNMAELRERITLIADHYGWQTDGQRVLAALAEP